MKSAHLGRESAHSSALTRMLRRYTHSLFTQISQSAACNRFHRVDARLARWMLTTQDRTGSDEFRLTQEFMSNMLGVRRERVNMAAGDLQREKLISYSRGMIKIRDRAGLETVACECYSIIKEETDSFLH
jgi:CRP-like cAMP-binding protein